MAESPGMTIDITPKIDEERLPEIAAEVRSTMKEAVLDGFRDALEALVDLTEGSACQ